MTDNSKGRTAINSWGISLIDDIKSPQRNSIAMGPFGSNIKKENFQAEGIPVIRGNNLKNSKFIDCDFVYISDNLANQLSASLARRLDIILTHRGTIGQVAIIPPDSKFNTYIVSQSQMKVTLDQTKCDPYFVYYFLRSEFGMSQFLSNSSQTGVPAIASPTSTLKSIKIPLPPLNEQKAIAKILSDLDAKIELNQKMNKTLEAIAQAIFKHWFIDFEFPNDEGRPYKSSGGEMVDSELGEIPKGWKIGGIKDIAKVKSGKRPIERSELKTETFSVELIGASSVMGYTKDYLFSENLVIIGRVGTHGVIQRTFRPSWPSDNTLVFITGNLEYIFQILKRVEYEALNVGSTQPLITQSQMENFEIIIPSKTILDVFENLSMIIYKKISTTNVESENLSSILSLLLPRLMSGKIRVPLED